MSENGPIELKLTKEGRERLEQENGPDPNSPELKVIQQRYEEDRRRREAKNPKINIDDLRREQGAKEIAEYRGTQRNLWIQHGDTDEEFEENWPRIKADHL